MTATPRLFSDDSKQTAAQSEAVLWSMDDKKIYGEEIYRIGFGEAVAKNLLTDYKVLILTLSDGDVPQSVQQMIANPEMEINTDDASKLIGCINALSKQILGDEGIIKETDPEPMRRAVAFCKNIKASKRITRIFNDISRTYPDSLTPEKRKEIVAVQSDHIDGAMSAPTRDEKMSWLKAESDEASECRVLTNVRCLSEGVDVPSLDAVMFLSARNSQVDVVQSVGRVMRRAEGKKYGYIIIPIVIPSDVEPEIALSDNARYQVVWSVLNALRAHDDRFNATINKIELNKNRPSGIIVGGIDHGNGDTASSATTRGKVATQLQFQFEQLQSIVFARMVKKVGNRRYWEQWAKDVAQIAERYIEKINRLIRESPKHQIGFNSFLRGLRKNLNPSISQDEAIEMLAQHIITRPVFEALFEKYSFVQKNPVSKSMQSILDLLEGEALEKDAETLQKFYESVRQRASGIDNAEGKQKIIVELYDKFFKTAFPKLVERLGIVYTPVEVVDFIIHSVNDVLKQEFGRSISDEGVHILDPFTGTGTFVTRLLQSGLIDKQDLVRKYTHELHANELVLLAYYIAAINIENAFHEQYEKEDDYISFPGICLTDTFQLGEVEGETLFSDMFPENSQRLELQRRGPIRVIMGNPPYSVGQKSANDNAQNQSYEKLDSRIANTYASASTAGLNKSLYDAYVKAFRWSSDRIDKKNGGIICFVSNGAWLDGNSQDGFRKHLENEFSTIYVFNLRGNQRTSGELSRKEGGKIFGSGSRTPIAITLLVKNPDAKSKKAIINYHDIGDYLSQKEKLAIISKFGSVSEKLMNWKILNPNKDGDWINQRNDAFDKFLPIQPKKKLRLNSQSFFNNYAVGINTARDAWTYNFSSDSLSSNMKSLIDFYNQELIRFTKSKALENVNNFVINDTKKISWSANLKKSLERKREFSFKSDKIVTSAYRPFCKQKLYFHRPFIERPGVNNSFFPNLKSPNTVICISSSPNDGISLLISNHLVNFHFNGDTQSFPLFYYEEKEQIQGSLFDQNKEDKYIRRDGISNYIFEKAKKIYGKRVTKEDVFYYVYGFLHSPTYRETFKNDLKKMLPRLPLVDAPKDFWAFSKAGRQLADLHIKYETIAASPEVEVKGAESGFYTVTKMRFAKKEEMVNGKKKTIADKSTIFYNSKITISNIPAVAYEYVVNGKSAIEWIMDRYRVTTHKASGIKNDPNDWSTEVGNERYILDLLLSVINVSVQTVGIVGGLPEVDFGGGSDNEQSVIINQRSKEKLSPSKTFSSNDVNLKLEIPAYLEMILDKDYDTFSNEAIIGLMQELEEEYKLSGPIRVLLKERGSVRLTLELPTMEDANHLLSLANSGVLKEYGVNELFIRQLVEIDKRIEQIKATSNIEKWKKECKAILAKGSTGKVIQKLLDGDFKEEVIDDATLLMNQWNRIQDNLGKGLVKHTDVDSDINRITLRVLDLVNLINQ